DKPHQPLPSVIQKAKHTITLTRRHDLFTLIYSEISGKKSPFKRWNAALRAGDCRLLCLLWFLTPSMGG
ncbi:hypothetical protein, partial [Serratia fonticola]